MALETWTGKYISRDTFDVVLLPELITSLSFPTYHVESFQFSFTMDKSIWTYFKFNFLYIDTNFVIFRVPI